MTKQDLTEYGFPKDDFNILYCRICNLRINTTGITVLLGTFVKYGWCKKWTHGVSVCKLMT